ncbi:MAG: UDP-N-acetylglucosamine 4,6-dehydratase (inverting) [Phycisphaerae bacterium]
MLDDKTILVTGGTGSFGKAFSRIVLDNYRPRKLIIFSRDELKQFEMRSMFPENEYPCLRYFIGDIRDKDRLRRAFQEVDIVVHAAAMKQVPACEYNPIEAIMTNVMGTRNVIEAALDVKVKRVLALSTDKAVNPVNLYGATKLCAEKLVVQSNTYSGLSGTRLSCVRYGNVMGSRGSVIPLFRRQSENGNRLTVTDPRMTRFWLTLPQGVRFVINCIELMQGGEVFVPKIPSMNIVDLARAVSPDCEINEIGIRPGEKLHEVLVSVDEARDAIELEDMYVIRPHSYMERTRQTWFRGNKLPDGFIYGSDHNEKWLSQDELMSLLGDVA